MDLDNVFVADIETDGFLEELTKLHVLGVVYKDSEGNYQVKTTNKEEDVKKLFENPDAVIVGHNFYLFDIPALEKLYNIEVKATIVDSLFIAWYIEPNRIKEGKLYGLESYGEDFGVKKPEITDWKNLSYEEYEHRVAEDTKINTNLFVKQLTQLRELYEGDEQKVESLINFLNTKAKVYKMHQDNPLRVDIKKGEENKEILEGFIQEKVDILAEVMPETPIKAKKKKPKVFYKKDGTLSASAVKWLEFLESHGLPEDHEEEVEYIRGYKKPNPQSPTQQKEWLFSLGWVPEIYNETINVAGEVNKVPQLKDKEKNLCTSVLSLVEKEPAIKELDDLGVLQHRLGMVKGFLRDVNEKGEIVAGIAGLTNTLRIRHKILVNMPKPSAPYGEYIRSLILPPKGHVMIGSDLSSLENITRNNFIIDIDPEYVAEMDDEFYDSHLDIGVTAGLITQAESIFYKWWKEKGKAEKFGKEVLPPETFGEITEDFDIILNSYKTDEEKEEFHEKLDKIRAQAKTVNYSALYGVGKVKLSKELKITQKEAKQLLDAYWKKNNSVKKFASSCKVKTVGEQMWVKNPLNGYWYSLRTEKDIFSVVNQSAGDYIFTLWEHFLMEEGVIIRGGWHDEVVTTCKPEDSEKIVDKLKSAINKVNKVLKLKIPVGIDFKIDKNYSKVH